MYLRYLYLVYPNQRSREKITDLSIYLLNICIFSQVFPAFSYFVALVILRNIWRRGGGGKPGILLSNYWQMLFAGMGLLVLWRPGGIAYSSTCWAETSKFCLRPNFTRCAFCQMFLFFGIFSPACSSFPESFPTEGSMSYVSVNTVKWLIALKHNLCKQLWLRSLGSCKGPLPPGRLGSPSCSLTVPDSTYAFVNGIVPLSVTSS